MVDDIKVGEVVRTVRRRRGLRQRDVAAAAGVSQWSVSAVERGQLEQLTLRAIRRVCSALEIRTRLAPRWRGVELPRLLDAPHAALIEEVVARLSSVGWETVIEYTFQHFGERGSVDVLGWQPEARALLMVEVKTDLDDLQAMLSAIDRKARLVPRLVSAERNWAASARGAILVMPEGSTSRWQVSRHPAVFAAAFPARNTQIRRWIEAPTAAGPMRGVWFLQSRAVTARIEAASQRGGSRRVRVQQNAAVTGKASADGRGGQDAALHRPRVRP
jgi:transcriptional regulator with XRE-family HTH domain